MPFHRSRSHIASPIPTPTPAMPRIPDDVLHRAWQTDPFVTDPQSIKAVVSQFFSHVDGTMVLTLLPERSTRAWVTDPTRRKLPEDLMLLYSILAVGVALSGGPKHIAFEYAQVAQYAQKGTQFNCLQLAQSRVLLALYYVSVGRKREANELMSAAAATVASLQLNLELDNSNEASISSFPMGLNRAGYCEARRRTIWSLFMLERLSGMFPDRVTMINPDDIYIRLPCDRRSFEEQVESLAPVFNPYSLSLSKMSNHSDEIATYLVMMVHLWAESQATVYRLVHRPASAEGEFSKVRGLLGSIESWQSTLPTRLSLNRSNLEAAATEGNMGPFASMHLLYHHAMIKLNRHSRAPRQLSSEARFHHVRACQEHAADTIDMVDSIDGLFRSRATNMSVPPPMLAIAVAEAVDVLSASQPLSLAKKVIDNIRRVRPPLTTWPTSGTTRATSSTPSRGGPTSSTGSSSVGPSQSARPRATFSLPSPGARARTRSSTGSSPSLWAGPLQLTWMSSTWVCTNFPLLKGKKDFTNNFPVSCIYIEVYVFHLHIFAIHHFSLFSLSYMYVLCARCVNWGGSSASLTVRRSGIDTTGHRDQMTLCCCYFSYAIGN
uniref:Xylanolytic transcriptional activator regulatory domain-containing protein n=1 Tax=Bionectria ochroleuca TaxID=29856 RepID=A0A8H7NGN9_BIOOC